MRWWIFVILIAATAGLMVAGAAANQDPDFVERFSLPRDPKAVLSEVLQRREFAEDPAGRVLRRIWDKALLVLEKMLRWLAGRIPSVGKVEITGDVLGTIGTALLIGVAAVILIFIGWKLGVALVRHSWKRDADHSLRLELEDTQSPESLRAHALRERDQGNFARALVLFFRYTILRLDEEGLMAYHQGKTNRELLAALKADDDIRSRVAEMVRMFNRVRYGRTPCDRQDYERFFALCRDVVGRV